MAVIGDDLVTRLTEAMIEGDKVKVYLAYDEPYSSEAEGYITLIGANYIEVQDFDRHGFVLIRLDRLSHILILNDQDDSPAIK
jgi:hypothetical protein